jgi:predicted acetyltransferase
MKSVNLPEIKMTSPRLDLESAFRRYVEDFREHGERKHGKYLGISHDQYVEYIDALDTRSRGVKQNERPGGVPTTTFWFATRNNEIAGMIRIRHELDDFFSEEGGHIGYDVAPSFRNEGIASYMLSAAVIYSRERLALGSVLVTCDEDNDASRRVIEKNGGVCTSRRISNRSGKPILHYQIRT